MNRESKSKFISINKKCAVKIDSVTVDINPLPTFPGVKAELLSYLVATPNRDKPKLTHLPIHVKSIKNIEKNLFKEHFFTNSPTRF